MKSRNRRGAGALTQRACTVASASCRSRRGSQVVRPGSAKPIFAGSIPAPASPPFPLRNATSNRIGPMSPTFMRKKIIIGVAALLVLVVAWSLVRARANSAGGAQSAGGRRGSPPQGAMTVPVVATEVAKRDVPIFLDGLGTVQAFNTVTVRARVDGELTKVSFTEGQDVKAGDELAIIDPRPYQAALDQAIAKKATDEAQLGNAKVTFARNAEL